MGLTRKTDLESYWSTYESIETPLFSKFMSKNRFLAILSNLHVVDNSLHIPHGQVGYDPLFKIGPFITMMGNYSDIYTPDQNLSFDEGICPFKGRVRFRVYNPMKPNKFGIKLYEVCEADTGYTVGFHINDGKGGSCDFSEAVDLDDECGQTTKTVVGLLARHGLLSKGYKVYLNNYYNSPEQRNLIHGIRMFAGCYREIERAYRKSLEW